MELRFATIINDIYFNVMIDSCSDKMTILYDDGAENIYSIEKGIEYIRRVSGRCVYVDNVLLMKNENRMLFRAEIRHKHIGYWIYKEIDHKVSKEEVSSFKFTNEFFNLFIVEEWDLIPYNGEF